MRTLISVLAIFGSLAVLSAQDKDQDSRLWQDIEKISVPTREKTQPVLPESFRLLKLDLDAMARLLKATPSHAVPLSRSTTTVEMPLPDGSMKKFHIRHNPVMHPDLSQKFPGIYSYEGRCVESPFDRIFFTFSPIGFHALILLGEKKSVIIHTVELEATEYYICYYEADYPSLPWFCGTLPHEQFSPSGYKSGPVVGDCLLRTYRLAMSTTSEFTSGFITSGDPTGVYNTMARINEFVTFVSGIYQDELGIRFELIPNNDQLIFTDPISDGYTNGDAYEMISENQDIVNMIIGAANYDFAHVIGSYTSGDVAGLATVGSVCQDGIKAKGVTLSYSSFFSTYSTDWATISTILHEFGHQFGATHTFNSTQGACAGNTYPGTAFEPGNGSTIMSYGGSICGIDFIPYRDVYFHAISLYQISNYITSGGGGCAIPIYTGNNQPNVDAGLDYAIPISTPFMLTAQGSDPDGDELWFSWEQMNNELVPNPPQPTSTNGPNFISSGPEISPTRYFPDLEIIGTGSSSSTWEVLPSVSRTMNFRVTARDYAEANGCTNQDDIVVTFIGWIGPFTVNQPITDSCLIAGEPTRITWNVAGTNQYPVHCTEVDIMLSTDGGRTFPYILEANTPNDGIEEVEIPDIFSRAARILIKCSDNIFFNVNPRDFTIECPEELIFTEDLETGIYKAKKRIETVGNVSVLSGTIFLAGEEIVLRPDLHIGSIWGEEVGFLARIEPCRPCEFYSPTTAATNERTNPQIIFLPSTYLDIPKETHVNKHNSGLLIFPNPVQSDFIIEVDLEQPGSLQISIYDINGYQIHHIHHVNHISGHQRIGIEAGQLPSGIYICRVITGNQTWQGKFIKAQ